MTEIVLGSLSGLAIGLCIVRCYAAKSNEDAVVSFLIGIAVVLASIGIAFHSSL